MKKTATLLLLLASLAGVCAGCGSSQTETTGTSGTEATDHTQATDNTAPTSNETTKPEDTTGTTVPEEKPPVEYTYEKEEGLVAYWAFDAISDGGVIVDVTGNGHDGEVHGKPEIVKGQIYNGIRFTGLGQYVTVKDAADLNFTANDSFTLEAWFRWDERTAGSNWPCLFQKGLVIPKSAYRYYGFWINNGSREGALGITGGGGTKTYNLMTKSRLTSGWHKATAVQDAEAGTIMFFLDGVYQSQGAAINASSKGYPLTIGYNGIDGQFIGDLDEVKIYNYAKKMDVKITGVDAMEYHTYEYKTASGQKVSLPYRSYFPADYDATGNKEYPILFFLHGYGECGTDNTQQIRVLGGPNGLLDRLIEDGSCIIVAPQCPADPASMNWVPINKRWATSSRELTEKPTPTLEAATALLMETIDKEKVDESRIYIAGISMGGYGTWEMLARNPKLFAAAIALCGAGIPSKADELTDVAIWAMHGTADPTVPLSGTMDMEYAIKEAGGEKIRTTYYKGAGHSIWPQAFSEPDLLEWLLAQHK